MNIYLVGFMGTGKTSVGRQLAKDQGWNFIDLDELIELKQQRRIVDIFAQEGEPYFRKAETKALKEAVKEDNFVIACGGGIVTREENILAMKETGLMVCLTASPAVIIKRISGCTHRPLLNVPDPKKQINILLKLRAPYYARADKTINTSRLSLKEVVRKIKALRFAR